MNETDGGVIIIFFFFFFFFFFFSFGLERIERNVYANEMVTSAAAEAPPTRCADYKLTFQVLALTNQSGGRVTSFRSFAISLANDDSRGRRHWIRKREKNRCQRHRRHGSPGRCHRHFRPFKSDG